MTRQGQAQEAPPDAQLVEPLHLLRVVPVAQVQHLGDDLAREPEERNKAEGLLSLGMRLWCMHAPPCTEEGWPLTS